MPESTSDATFDTTRTAFSLVVNGVTKKYPNIRFVLAHAGGAVPYLAGRVSVTASMLAGLGGAMPAIAEGMGKIYSLSSKWQSKMPEQLSYYLRFKDNVLPEGPDHFLGTFYYDTALSASAHCFASLLTVVDSSHIVFGTDYVFAAEAAVPIRVEGVQNYAGFAPADVQAIARDNVLRLFPEFG
ncbi:amidohydrolase family protein [Arthrobacter sp. LAR12-1-1.1]|uniref:amidohydrolase family protein n=1 Tax=Arthrobacter sp. LAR12-1-1.1 TaxID=3135215 RepID=UPI0034149B2D